MQCSLEFLCFVLFACPWLSSCFDVLWRASSPLLPTPHPLCLSVVMVRCSPRRTEFFVSFWCCLVWMLAAFLVPILPTPTTVLLDTEPTPLFSPRTRHVSRPLASFVCVQARQLNTHHTHGRLVVHVGASTWLVAAGVVVLLLFTTSRMAPPPKQTAAWATQNATQHKKKQTSQPTHDTRVHTPSLRRRRRCRLWCWGYGRWMRHNSSSSSSIPAHTRATLATKLGMWAQRCLACDTRRWGGANGGTR